MFISRLDCPLGSWQEIYYYTNHGNKIRDDDVVTESARVAIEDKGNKVLGESLIADDGPLGAGARPNVIAATEEGQKKLLESLDPDSHVEKKKPKRTPKNNESTEQAQPLTLDESIPQPLESHMFDDVGKPNT